MAPLRRSDVFCLWAMEAQLPVALRVRSIIPSLNWVCCMQWLIYNDCLFRWRQVYEHILFVDRDEFLYFPGKPLGEVSQSSSCKDLHFG